MEELFERCLTAKYIHTAEGGDRAIEVEDDGFDASNSNSNIGGRLVYRPL